ncbi:MAG: DUF5119 domain-containing protein [Bacteroidales bacterium]|nr:DUF5119 domain-containing protein [Bacteroidales bacterium]MBR3499825.1 DUF5119 domain-containing protein [Bacteroidales bacterium]
MIGKRLIRILIVAASIAVAGCTIEPILHLRKAIRTMVVVEPKINVDVMWQLNWAINWQFNWNVSALGPVGYTPPASLRMHVFTHGPEGEPISHFVHNFVGDETQLEIFIGTHDLLFHNNDSEALLFQQDGDLGHVHSYTRKLANGLKASTQVLTIPQKLAGQTKAPSEFIEPVNLTPDNLFSLYNQNQVITDNLDDYEYIDGKYVLRIEGELYPSTFIYLFQIRLLNNDDRVIGSAGGAALTGMSQGVDLMTRQTWEPTASYLMDVYMDKPQDMLGAKVFTFGIPGCNPYDAASVAAAPDGSHYLVLNVSYVNGSNKNISLDVTDKIRELPLGGVIDLEIDVNDFPPDESAGGDGGFVALIGDWDEQTGSATIIN